MHCLNRPTTLFVLCLYVVVPLVFSQDRCGEFEDFECQKESPRRSIWAESIYEEEPNCGDNLVETTLKLFEEGDKVIDKQMEQFGPSGEAVLMIGSTGTGKSTLTYFIAGNDSAIIAFDRYGEIVITDCNGKIGGSGIISQTTFPELVLDTDTSTSFFDYPGFFDTRAACVEIANAYFMLSVARKVPRAKFVIVAEYASVTGGNKGAFPKLLQSVMNFIPSIESFAPGIAFVATKVDKPTDLDSKLVRNIQGFLTDAKKGLAEAFQGEDDIRKATFLVDTFLVDGRIGLFRKPNDCGPLSEIPLMQENTKSLENVIFTNLNFVPTQEQDFGVSLSGEAKLQVINLRGNLSNMLLDSFKMVRDAVTESLTFDCANSEECMKSLATVGALFEDDDFINGYETFDSWNSSSLNTIVVNTTHVYFEILGSSIDPNISASLDTNSNYVDFLGTLDNVMVDIPPIYKPLQDLKRQVAADVLAFSTNLGLQIENLLEQFSETIYENVFPGSQCSQAECEVLLKNLQVLFDNFDFKNEYPFPGNWLDLTYTEIIDRIVAFEFTGFTINPQIINSLLYNSKYLDVLKGLDIEVNVNLFTWLSYPQLLKRKVSTGVSDLRLNWTTFITDSLMSVSYAVENSLTFDCKDATNCKHVMGTAQALYGDSGFINGYKNFDAWNNDLLNSIIMNTTQVYFDIPGIDVNPSVSKYLDENSKYIDLLGPIDNVKVDLPLLYQPLQTLTRRIASGIQSVSLNLNSIIETLIQQFSEAIYATLFPETQCVEEGCQYLMINLQTLFENSDFKNEFPFPGNEIDVKYTAIVSRIVALDSPAFSIDPQIKDSLLTYSGYLDIIKGLGIEVNLNVQAWLAQPQLLRRNVTSSMSTLHSASVAATADYLEDLSTEILAYLPPKYDCIDVAKCLEILTSLEGIFSDPDFKQEYKTFESGKLLNQIIIRTTNIFYLLPGNNFSQVIAQGLRVNSMHVDILMGLEKFPLNVPNIYNSMQEMQRQVKLGLPTLAEKYDAKVKSLLDSFQTSILQKLFPNAQTQCTKEGCKTLLTDLTSLYLNNNFNQSYANPGTWKSFEETTSALVNLKFEQFELDKVIISQLKSYSQYLDRLKKIHASLNIIVDDWLKYMKNFKTSTNNGISTILAPSVYTYVRSAIQSMYVSLFDTKVTTFSGSEDIYAVPQAITAITRALTDYKGYIDEEYLLEGGLVAKSFVDKTIENFKTLGFTNPKEDFEGNFNPTLFFNFFTKYGFSTEIKKNELQVTWYESLTNFEKSISNENRWFTFLVELIADLTNKKTQIDGIWKFKDWWTTNGKIDATDNNVELKLFWSKFADVPSVKNLYINDAITALTPVKGRQSKFDSLNTLLETTLTSKLTCSEFGGVRDCKGIFVSVKDVLSYKGLYSDSEVNSIVIKAYHTLYVDALLTGSKFNNGGNIDVYIISPTWDTTVNSINLDGVPGKTESPIGGSGGADGKPGGLGGNAGNFYGIGRFFPGTFPAVSVNGGKGGDGQDGQNGRSGSSGTIKYPSCDDNNVIICASHCTATSGQVTLAAQFEPCSCTNVRNGRQMETNTRSCKAGDDGARFTIPGTLGTPGQNGGNGGQPGKGGYNGKVFLKGVEDGSAWDNVGTPGTNGVRGLGAQYGGSGGRNGMTHTVTIDDVGGSKNGTRVNKRCQRNSSYNTEGALQPDGNQGRDGASGINPIPPTPHTFNYLRDVPVYIGQFKSATDVLKTNKFFKAPLIQFLDKIEKFIQNP